ncbi:hypothetical protein [Streptomyces lavendulocolor]|uniref:hypothetical protein n=1 Tax=Streptomyces lavendulocolor TaxID=67316 RepID=UPI003C2E3307
MSTARLSVLRTAVAQRPGPWTTQKVRRLYAAQGIPAPFRGTARRDLDQVAREGLLTRDDSDPNRRVFRRPKGAAR